MPVKPVWLLLLLALFVAPLRAQQGFLPVHGDGPPTSLHPVPNCAVNREYIDDLTGTIYTASSSQGYPCAWVANVGGGSTGLISKKYLTTDSAGNLVGGQLGPSLSGTSGVMLNSLGGLSAYPGGYTAYGDSITAGYGVSNISNSYAYLVNSDINRASPFHDYGIAGSTALDMSVEVFDTPAPTPSGNPVVTTMIGTNDATQASATSAANETAFLISDYAANAWRAMSSTDKVMAQSSLITQAGTWATDATFTYGPGLVSSTNASTLTDSAAQVGPSGVMYLWYYVYGAGAGGTFTVSVDGAAQTDTISGSSTISATTAGDYLYHFTFPVVGMARFTGISQGSHSVVIKVTSSSGSVGVIALGFPPARQYGGNTAPSVVVGGVPYEQNNGNGAAVSAYNRLVANEVSTLDSDGLDARFVDVQSYLDDELDFASTATQNCAASTVPGLHPNDCGHRHLANAFEAAIGYLPGQGVVFPSSITSVDDSPGTNYNSPNTNAFEPGLNIYERAGWSSGFALANFGGTLYPTLYYPSFFGGVAFCPYTQGAPLASTTQCLHLLVVNPTKTGTNYLVTTQRTGNIIPLTTVTTGAGLYNLNSDTYYGYWWNQEPTASAGVTYMLYGIGPGAKYCVGNSNNGTSADTGVLTVEANTTAQIIGADGTLGALGGSAVSGGAAGDYACFIAVSNTQWQIVDARGTWTIH